MNDMKLHVGCGQRNFGSDWVHIDNGDYRHLDIQTDIRLLGHYYSKETFDLIYSSHVIEYFDREEVIPILKDWISLLKEDGILRLAVPDFKKIAELYLDGGYCLERFLGPLYGKMAMGDTEIYHKTVYDEESLKLLMDAVGLNNIQWWDWRKVEHGNYDDHSQAYIPHMQKESGILISLNLEGVK